ncbi:MAG: class I SAM-dependent methyltransferase [Gammaproteobacteria bacterium]
MAAFLARRVELRNEIRSHTDREYTLIDGRRPVNLDGHCGLCNRNVVFTADWQHSRKRSDNRQVPNWRERLVCPCGINSRLRASLHFMKANCGLNSTSSVYLTEQATSFFELVKGDAGDTIGSEHLGDKTPLGGNDQHGIRNEDITRLTFDDGQFDIVGSFDVLEHVPDYRTALCEMYRVLRSGGSLVVTAPFRLDLAQTLMRARLRDDGSIEHLHPPEYHGDPQNPHGVLCYYHFGWDILDDMCSAGFAKALCHLYWSWDLGYLGGLGILFHGIK